MLEIIQGKTTVAEASRAHDRPPSEIETWVDDGKRGMDSALRADPLDVREQYERQFKDLQEAYGEAMREFRVREKLQPLLGEDDQRDDRIEPVLRVSDGGPSAGVQQQHGKAHLPA